MAEPSLVFPASEFRRRAEALQDGMARAGLGALLFTEPADIFYLTGFLTRFWESPARPWFVVLPPSGAPIAVIPPIGPELMARTWLTDIRTWPAPDPEDDGLRLLSATLAAYPGPVGLPMGAETSLRMPLATYHALREGHAFADATRVVQSVREIKSEREIAALREICAIAGAAFAQVPEIVAREGRLDGVFRGFQAALLAAGADWVSYLAGGAGQGGYGDVISPAAPSPLQRGDVLMLDTGAVKNGYFCDFDRNFSIGPVAEDVRRAHLALGAAIDHALGRLRPGMTAAEAHGLLAQPLLDMGFSPCDGRLGHGLGVTLTEWPSFTPKDQTPLRAGMVLTLEPSVTLGPGRILVHEENIVLRGDGPELLSPRAPQEMPEI